MEFETNTPTTDADVARADIPHMIVQPLHTDIRTSDQFGPQNSLSDRRIFSFESEATSAQNDQSAPTVRPHSHIALLLTIVTVAIFSTALIVIMIHRY